MRRVVVTGLGLVSSIGSTTHEAARALRDGRSGLAAAPELRAAGLPCGVYAPVRGFSAEAIEARARRSMSTAALYAAVAGRSALGDAGVKAEDLEPARTAVVVGGEMGGVNELHSMSRLLHAGKKSRCGANGVTKAMDSTASGNLAALVGLKGRAYSVAAGAGTGMAALGHAFELIAHGAADAALCGAAEEDCWRQVGPGLAERNALPGDYDDRPTEACRPFDADRQGMVLSAGAGIVYLESLDRARRRGANIRAEVVGWGSAPGGDFLRPTGRGLRMALEKALGQARQHGVGRIDYVASQASGTRLGDALEARVLAEILGDGPWVSSTVGLTGYAWGASAAVQFVLALTMMQGRFIAPGANLRRVAPECEGPRHVRDVVEGPIGAAVCVASGLGGECVVFRALET